MGATLRDGEGAELGKRMKHGEEVEGGSEGGKGGRERTEERESKRAPGLPRPGCVAVL